MTNLFLTFRYSYKVLTGQRTRSKREVTQMVTEINTTVELNPQLTNLATDIGLNVQKICENALKLAIYRLQGKTMVDGAGFEPATSTMPTWRSYQADLPAHSDGLQKL